MNIVSRSVTSIRWFHPLILIAVALGVSRPNARAGLTMEINVIRYHEYGYYFSPYLNTNSAAPSVPFGDYYVTSFGQPTNGSSAFYHFDTNGFNQIGGGPWGYGDFDGMMHELTNQTWAIAVTNSLLTNVYHFKVTANISSNDLPYVDITSPANGALNVTNQPTFIWKGPTNYNNLIVYYYNNGDTLPVTQTSLLSSRVLYQGLNSVTVHYDSNSTTAVVCTVPTNNAGQTLSSWVSQAHLQDYATSQFTIGTVDPSGTSHALVARYAWNNTNIDGTASGVDTSGNNYNMNFGGGFGSQGGANSTTTAAAGARAIQFHNGDDNSAGYVGWNPTPTNLLSALSGSFSVSCWIKTTQTGAGGWDEAPAYYGAGIVSAENSGLANDVIPLALTGSKIGFNTGGDDEDVTLNSQAQVNDGNYHHVVVTRKQSTGQKIMYIDGVLDSFSSGTTNLLADPLLLTIGALSDARNSDAPSTYYYNGFDGFLDDLQIYTGVLSSNEVASLFANPGTTADQIINVPLVARYNFEITNDIFTAGTDTSGNGNDANCSTGNGGPKLDTFSSDAAIGSYARLFNGDTAICFYQGSTTFNHLSNTIYGSFSWTAWVKTTNAVNADFANAYFGLPILFGYDSGLNQMILSLTGTKVAFTTGNPGGGSDTTLHSTTTVTDGNYHLIAATRNANSGVMKLYVDGNLEATDLSTNGPRTLTYGMTMAGGGITNFNGLLDDVRIYGGELSASDVGTLAGHAPQDFNAALNTTNLTWTTGGDASWYVQSTNTHDGSLAAQSGVIGDDQSTWIETTVSGPGTLTFWWNVSSEDGADYLEFLADGNWLTDITGDWGWDQFTYNVPAGQHTLRWNYYKDGSVSDFSDAGFLDQITFTSGEAPIITVDPFSQTNYPGYSVALKADATGVPPPIWQWFKNGVYQPGFNTSLFIPTNSGTAGVAGDYYAVAVNSAGAAVTRTAKVTFVSAPFPPDWSTAYGTPIYTDFEAYVTNYGIACLVDSAGNVYSANSFTGTNSVGTNTLASGPGRFGTALIKLTPGSSVIWARGITNTGSGNSYPQCLAPAPGDGVYLSGVFFGTNWLGTNKLAETAGGSTYLARFDSAGNTIWVRTIGGTNFCFQSYHELVADPAGNVTISLLAQDYVSVGGATNLLLSGQRGLLAQFDANGAFRWVGQSSSWVQNIAYHAGRIYGSMGGAETNYIGGLTNTSDRQWVLVALNGTNGQAAWLRNVGSALGNSAFADTPHVTASGSNVFLVGSGGGGGATFGAFSVSWSGSVGQYFARYDTNGNAQLATSFGSETTLPWVAVADATGNVYVGADFDDYSVFGSRLVAGPHANSIGNGFPSQCFVAKFDRNGSNQWARTGISPSYASLRDIALASDGIWGVGFLDQNAKFGSISAYGPVVCFGSPFCTLEYLTGGWVGKITESSGGSLPLPVTLLNLQYPGTTFQFSFASQTGFNHLVLYRTNLSLGTWLTNSTVPGDGSVKTVNLPLSTFGGAKQGFVRVLTQ